MEEENMIDLQPLTTAESTADTHDFGREYAMPLVDPRERDGVDTPVDQLNALIADELFTA
jgi:hypothetical protein